jgi:hypothetical protein
MRSDAAPANSLIRQAIVAGDAGVHADAIAGSAADGSKAIFAESARLQRQGGWRSGGIDLRVGACRQRTVERDQGRMACGDGDRVAPSQRQRIATIIVIALVGAVAKKGAGEDAVGCPGRASRQGQQCQSKTRGKITPAIFYRIRSNCSHTKCIAKI